MAESFISVAIREILVGEELPCPLYIFIDGRHIVYRAQGDSLDLATHERLELKKVANLFVLEKDHAALLSWSAKQIAEPAPAPLPEANKEFRPARADAKRAAMDIFQAQHPEAHITQAVAASKKLVAELMKLPYALQTLAQLQTYSRDSVDHSVNVSILSVYLALQMGYSHTLILQNVGLGALLHDVGKRKIPVEDNDPPELVEKKMKDHPTMGLRILEPQANIPSEVKMIVAQHHECADGTGYPKKLRGSQIYDLARIVAIANIFDELVINASGPLTQRQKKAVQTLDQQYYNKFDADKLEKAIKILKMGL